MQEGSALHNKCHTILQTIPVSISSMHPTATSLSFGLYVASQTQFTLLSLTSLSSCSGLKFCLNLLRQLSWSSPVLPSVPSTSFQSLSQCQLGDFGSLDSEFCSTSSALYPLTPSWGCWWWVLACFCCYKGKCCAGFLAILISFGGDNVSSYETRWNSCISSGHKILCRIPLWYIQALMLPSSPDLLSAISTVFGLSTH